MPHLLLQNALFIVSDYMENQTMGEYVRLAQINRDFRSVFLSDAAWAKFSVYGAQDVYRHGRYELRGTAARFYNYLTNSAPHVRGWLLNCAPSDDGPLIIASVTAADRYSQLRALTLFVEIREPCDNLRDAFLERVPLIALDVWRLWATHVRRPRGRPIRGLETALPAPVAGDKQVVLALIQQEWISSFSDVLDAFDDDRDINLVVAIHYLSARVGLRLPLDQFLQDPEFVLEALHFANSDCAKEDLRSIVKYQWGHKAIVLKVVSMYGHLLEHASEKLRADHEIVLAAAKRSPWSLVHARGTLMNDRQFLLKALEVQLPAAQVWRPAREIVLQAVKVYGRNLRWAPVEFRGDREIVLSAVQSDGCALEHAAEPLRGDRGVVLEALKWNGSILRHASAQLRNDRQLVLDAVKCDADALRHASAELRNDRQLVLDAVKCDADALCHASAQLRNDRQLVLDAVKCDADALRHASAQLRNDRKIVLEAVKKTWYALRYASEALQNDRQVVFEAVKNGGYALEHAPVALRADGFTVLAAIRQDPSAFRSASAALRADRKFVSSCLKVVKSLDDWDDSLRVFWKYVPDEVRRDQGFILKMIVQGVLPLFIVPTHLSNYRHLVLCAVQNDASELFYAPEELRRDRSFMLCVIKQNGDALQWVDPRLQADKKLVFNAVWQSPSALRYASQELRDDPDILAAAQGRTRWFSCFRV